MPENALEGVRVLDLTTEMGHYAGKLLADLGADVIKVEPLGGDPARARPPFFHDQVSRETSLAFWYFNTNKRSLTLDLAKADGQALLRRLVDGADILLESFAPGQMDAWGLGYETLRAQRPTLVYVSITGFGLDGPHAGWQVTDLIAQAMSGIATLAGDPRDPPNRIAGNQAYIVASIAAVQGALLALLHAEASGEGQVVESAMQEALSICQETAHLTWDFQKTARERQGELIRLPGIGTYETTDGYIYSMVGVPGFGAPWTVLLDWMKREGKAGELEDPKYAETMTSLNMRTLTAALNDPEQLAKLKPIMDVAQAGVAAFYASKTSAEVYTEGQAQRLLIGIVSTPKNLSENEQLAAREWWVDIARDGETARYPGPPYRLTGTPVTYRRPAPAAGEHTTELMAELGVPAGEQILYAAEGVL